MKTLFTDALIIGTGFGGSAPALRFAEAGFKTIILEKGPHIDPFKDLKMTQDPGEFRNNFCRYCKEVHYSQRCIDKLLVDPDEFSSVFLFAGTVHSFGIERHGNVALVIDCYQTTVSPNGF